MPVAARSSALSPAAIRCCSTELVSAPGRGGSRRRYAGSPRTAPGWSLDDGTGTTWQADAVVLAVPGPAGGRTAGRFAPRAAAAAGPHPGRLGRSAGDGGRAGNALPGSIRCAGGDRRTFARQGDHAVRPVNGERAVTPSCCDCHSADSATILPAPSTMANCRRGPLTTWQRFLESTVEPLGILVHRWLDALPQYAPGHGDLAAESPGRTTGHAGGHRQLSRRRRGAGLCGRGRPGGRRGDDRHRMRSP